MKKLKSFGITMDKFNKMAKPFIIEKGGKEVSVVPYIKVVDYLFDLHKRLVKATDLIEEDDS